MERYRKNEIRERYGTSLEGGYQELTQWLGNISNKAVFPGMDSMREEGVVIVGRHKEAIEGQCQAVLALETDLASRGNGAFAEWTVLLEANGDALFTRLADPDSLFLAAKAKYRKQSIKYLFFESMPKSCERCLFQEQKTVSPLRERRRVFFLGAVFE